jgi:hypothetical protein
MRVVVGAVAAARVPAPAAIAVEEAVAQKAEGAVIAAALNASKHGKQRTSWNSQRSSIRIH